MRVMVVLTIFLHFLASSGATLLWAITIILRFFGFIVSLSFLILKLRRLTFVLNSRNLVRCSCRGGGTLDKSCCLVIPLLPCFSSSKLGGSGCYDFRYFNYEVSTVGHKESFLRD